ncbi:response regulator [Roseivirga echinicomitans]|uniref:Histidine kinase n=1 Tax=Roseivirga echinicomitans TaxID=296218 RepID=A0A150X362_9BACT|nr:response regulator [Roseivirga echinicomitans]KYG73153.1 histidine kinase [Roseivirga echinicomitans]
MNKKLNCILLIDDDDATNFIHQLIIKKAELAEEVITTLDGKQALEYLTNSGQYANTENALPSLIFLDINMPVMGGWGFIEAYQELDESIKKQIVIVMLTTSYDPDDKDKAQQIPEIAEFDKKPLTFEMLDKIAEKYFSENI